MLKPAFKCLALIIALLLPASLLAAPTAYALEADRSQVGFVFTLNAAEARGEMPVSASDIAIDFDNLARSRVDVTVDVRRATTGFFFATEAMKGASVLNAKAHPTIRFTSTRVRLNGSGRLADGAQIDGTLTIRGVTRPITLDAALFRQRGTDPNDLSRLSFRLNGTLSRAAFGASGYGNLVDDTVRLDIVARVKR
ncbi:MAG: YceI family protein [Pseudomonadota bacterium]